MKKETETVIATNGKAYTVNLTTKTAKKVFNSLAELKSIKAELEKNSKVSYNAYLSFLRDHLSSDPIKVHKNAFMVRGFKFVFYPDHIECKDILNFSKPVPFKDLPTPKDILDFLNGKKEGRVFTPGEMSAAVLRGKKLLIDESKVEVEKLAKVDNTETLLQAKAKALRLINRIKKRQSDNTKIFTEIPGMIKYRPLQTAIGITISYYHKKQLRWSKFIERIETLIRNETFVPKPAKPEKFTGVDVMVYKSVEPINTLTETLIVDGAVREAGEFFARYILERDNNPEVMPQMMKWLKKDITDEDFLQTPILKDRMIAFDARLLKGIKLKQVEVLHEIIYTMGLFDPTKIVYNKGGKYKVGQKLKVLCPELGTISTGKVADVEKGVMVEYKEGVYPLIISQIVKVIS